MAEIRSVVTTSLRYFHVWIYGIKYVTNLPTITFQDICMSKKQWMLKNGRMKPQKLAGTLHFTPPMGYLLTRLYRINHGTVMCLHCKTLSGGDLLLVCSWMIALNFWLFYLCFKKHEGVHLWRLSWWTIHVSIVTLCLSQSYPINFKLRETRRCWPTKTRHTRSLLLC